MQIIRSEHGYQILFNGSKAYMVVCGDQCYFATTSKIKANNFFNRLLKDSGY